VVVQPVVEARAVKLCVVQLVAAQDVTQYAVVWPQESAAAQGAQVMPAALVPVRNARVRVSVAQVRAREPVPQDAVQDAHAPAQDAELPWDALMVVPVVVAVERTSRTRETHSARRYGLW
jgi:hypothetical protein